MNTKDIELDLDALPWRGSSLAVTPIAATEGSGEVSDLLATMFEAQHQLMEKYHDIEERNGCVVVPPEVHGELDDRQLQLRLKYLMWNVVEELGEAANCLKNKSWSDSFTATDVDHFQEELADAFHFFVEMLITAGFSPESFFRVHFKKVGVNEFRQRSGY